MANNGIQSGFAAAAGQMVRAQFSPFEKPLENLGKNDKGNKKDSIFSAFNVPVDNDPNQGRGFLG